MNYLAILQTDDEEYICLETSKVKAMTGVFDGFNTHIKKILETKHSNPLVDVTSEWLASRLEKYYRHYLGGKFGMETLNDKYKIIVLEMEYGKVYKDGSETPTREQDY